MMNTTVTIDTATLSGSANPSTVGVNGTSTVTIIATLGTTGQAVAAGTEILMITDLGSIADVITTDQRGSATTTFRSQTAGTAMVIAQLGTATATVHITIN